MKNVEIAKALKAWFVIHFAVDMLFAIPLMLAPVATLRFLGWQTIDPISTRVVAAALFGIGIESYLGRNAGREAYLGMLNLKIIWSSSAIVGIGWSLLAGYADEILIPSLALLLFVAFGGVWVFWRIRLSEAT